jgi:uncharacterized membrane protein
VWIPRLKEPLFTEPPALLAFLACIVVAIFGLARVQWLKPFFRYAPPLIWTYFIPMGCSTLGIIPSVSPLYKPFMANVILPIVLVLLLVPSDTRSVARLGPKAVAVMLTGTLGIVLGAVVSFGLLTVLLPAGTLPTDLWKGVAALAGSWIGGGANYFSVAESVGTDATLLGKLVVVDTVVGYTWLGILVGLTGVEDRIDQANRADNTVIQDLARRLSDRQAARARPIQLFDFALMIALAVGISQVCLWIGGGLETGVARLEASSWFWEKIHLSQVLSGFGWAILLISVVSVALSLTRLQRLEDCGATPVGYVGLYLLLTTIGARADLSKIQPEDLWLFVLGALWIVIHVTVLFVGVRLLRAPLFLGATGSMANIGGVASAPVVAAAFHPSLAPVGLVMAILGNVIGTPVALLVIGKICASIAAP